MRLAGGLVMIGNHDCREAIIHNLMRLEQYGNFIEPWEGDPHIWLRHHDDTLIDVYTGRNTISQERIAKLPEFVRKSLGVAATTPGKSSASA